MRTIAALLLFPLFATPVYAKPNIVVILTDDQDVTSMPYMPKVNSLLVQHGVTFSNSFVNFPLCCPSRVSFLTGQASHNTDVTANNFKVGGGWRAFQPKEDNTLPVWLQAAGYRTALMGKYLNEYGQDPLKQAHRHRPSEGLLKRTSLSWSELFHKYVDDKPSKGGVQQAEAPPAPVPPGWNTWFGLTKTSYFAEKASEDGVLVTFGKQPTDYTTDVLRDRAVHFISDQSGSDQPFFLLIATNAPHEAAVRVPAVPAPRHAELFADIALPRSPAFNEQDVSDKPAWIRNTPLLNDNQIANLDQMYRAQLQALQSVDDLVESVVESLQDAGKLDNTVIFYMSDNGFLYGDHRLRTKGVAYENSIRVPLVVRGPGIAENQTSDRLVNNLDVSTTIEELAGAKPGLAPDGHSMTSLFVDPDAEWRSALLVEGGNRLKPEQLYAAVRTLNRKYVRYEDGTEELYDLERDPYELENKLNTPGYAADLTSLRRLYDQLQDCEGTSCWIQ